MFQTFLNILFSRGDGAQAGPSMDGVLNQMDRHLDNFATLVRPAPESRPRTPFDSGLPRNQMSMMNLKPQQRLRVLKKAGPLFLNMQRAARMYDGRVPPAPREASPALITQLEALAYAAGVKDIKYVDVPQNAIFRDKGLPCTHAITFSVEMDKAPIDTSPSFESQLEVMRGYKNMAVIANKLADFLHHHGFAAYPGTALGGVTDYVYLAELAGLGAVGYHGLLITPGEGARVRINTIYTNIANLPIATENPHLWIRDFCARCRKCVRTCPVDAIYDQPEPRGDGGMQCIEHATCRTYFAQSFGCAVCLAACPFSQVGYATIKARFKGNPDAPQFRIPVAARRVPTC